MTSTEPRGAGRSRRRALALGLAVAAAGGVTLAGSGVASAQVPPCQEYVVVGQATSSGAGVGPSTFSLSPGGFNISQAAPQTKFVYMAGTTRPRRSATFRYINQNNAVVRTFTTTASGDNGVIRQEPNTIPYDFTNVGDQVQIFADFRTRCGGDDVPFNNVFVGTITTVP
jgi:hypothetical protein